MVNVKKKGNAGEHAFSAFLQSHGFKAYKNSSSGGNENKSDIHNSMGMNWEVKTCKKINLFACWKQTDRDSSLARSMPMLAIHFDGMPAGEWLIVQHSSDWIEMYKNSLGEIQTVEVPQEDSREKKWAIQNAISSLKKLEKFYE